MQLGPFTLTRTKAIPLAPLSGRGGWWRVISEPFTGAWQRNMEITVDNVLTYSAVFACVTQIAGDISKLRLRLVEEVEDEIWVETDSPAFSPVLRKPNRYQNRQKFIETWMTSKLIHGNTYVLKARDGRGLVTSLYVLDPTRVKPLVAEDGGVYYELRRDDLSGLRGETPLIVPAREMIHDTMISLFHPLIGVSPIYACGAAAMQGLAIQNHSTKFFGNGAQPGGVLTAPGSISDEAVARIKTYWESEFRGDNVGKIAVLGDGLHYEPMSVNAVDAQLLEQLKWTGDTVCTCFHVPAYMVNIGPPPPYANIDPLIQQYYSQCLQVLITALEICLDEGLELPAPYGTEFDLADLIWMDHATRSKAAQEAISSGGMSINEARARFYGLGSTKGGESPYLQQQNYSLEALAERDANEPFAKPAPVVQALPPADDADEDDEEMPKAAAYRVQGFGEKLALMEKGLYAA